jgi:regulator of sirC expression with transglutaminase-like and TPR domain
LESTNPYVSPRAHELLATALASEPYRLDLAALAVSALEYPELDLAACERSLGLLAERVVALCPSPAILQRLQALRRVLSDEEGFRGNGERYHEPDNSYLNRVLERRLGLPISLSILYMEVGRRAGTPLFGVSFPGHFLVACELDEGRKLILDPFNGGKLLTETGCEDLLKQVAPQVRFNPRLLTPAPVKSIAYRMLNNLKRVYLDLGDGERALRVVDLMLALAPDHPGELRARAAILSALGAYRAALSDVERCLELSPDAPDHQSLQLTAKALRQRVEFLN